ncbi:MAG: UTP--glucose-1-phosphate uridylyltransferase [Planctomycetes bacterium]|nr:UTP--glucose-1-phosphate uridylyltransferase [Planctomycetota bacterium]
MTKTVTHLKREPNIRPGSLGGQQLSAALLEQITRADQSSILRFWTELSSSEQEAFVHQLNQVDWGMVAEWRLRHVSACQESNARLQRVQPPSHLIRRPQTANDETEWAAARDLGRELLQAGRVGVLLVAGGMASRLGISQPKGMFPIGPVSGASLYQLLAEQVVRLNRRYQVSTPYLIMTSDATHDSTVSWFSQHNSFGLNPADVYFFRQGVVPAFDASTGELLLASKSSLVLSPDGHGGVLDALSKAGLFAELRRRGIESLFYHQVDNPLVHVCDPAFLGFHVRNAADVSTKVVEKQSASEKVGVAVEIDGHAEIVEYSNLPAELSSRCEPDGRLQLRAGSTAIHVFQRDFLERAANQGGGLPWHKVVRSVPCINAEGQRAQSDAPNGLKFERYIFDILPSARHALFIETERETEFAPLKNAVGDHSATEVQAAMVARAAARLRRAGVQVATGIPVEISPLAVDPDEAFTLQSGCPRKVMEPHLFGADDLTPSAGAAVEISPAPHPDAHDTVTTPLVFTSQPIPRIWGGRALENFLGHQLPTDQPYGESWDLSDLPEHSSYVAAGVHSGATLNRLWTRHSRELSGRQHESGDGFPLLIKWLDCRDWLSLQVHPCDKMAREVLGQPRGKSEVWVVLQAEPTARIYAGLRTGISRDEFLRHLHAGSLDECLHMFVPQAGDCISLPAGTIHAAGGGLVLAEVQQSSDATFRLFDWNRLGLDGKPRPLQIESALQAINWSQQPIGPVAPQRMESRQDGIQGELLVELNDFRLERFTLFQPCVVPYAGEMTIWMVVDGAISMADSLFGERHELVRGRTVLIPAAAGPVTLEPIRAEHPATLLCVRLPDAKSD